MNLAEHAKLFVEEQVPHLRGEFQTFVAWVEHREQPVEPVAETPTVEQAV